MQILVLFGKHRRSFALAMLIGTASLFAYSFVRWQGTVGVDPDLRPLKMVYFSAALSLQAVEATFRPRSPAFGIGMLVLAILLLVLGSLSPS